ncbi:hypothetical protein VTK73DRAFT_5043 [Phialemonium thermophilum]|uniref:GPI mannosyltransferase 2 n=1 Tax=Phialemonium thermophilum TaxID=223376 RepID=A0ABR3V4F7_9PEZI
MHPHLGRSVSHLLLASTGWSQLALALASTSPSLQAAARVPTPDLAFAACQMALRPPTFNDTLPSKLTQACLSRWGVTSLYLCLRVFAPEGFATEGFAHQNHSCSAYLRAPLPPADIVDRDHFSDEEVARVRRLQREEATDETVLGEVVIPSDRLFWLSYDTLDTILYVHKYHFLYGAAVFVFWALVVLVGVLVRVGSVLSCARSRSPYQPLPRRTEEDDEEVTLAKRAARGNRLSVWLARYITVPATFGYRCAQNVDWVTIPPRVQSITILAFVLLNTAFCIHGYRSFPGNM